MLLGKIYKAIQTMHETRNAICELEEKVELIEQQMLAIREEIAEAENIKEDISLNADRIIEYIHSRDWKENKYLRGRLQDIAGNQTAQFIINNLNTTPTLTDSLEILDKDIEEIEIKGLYLEFGVFQGRTINRIARQVENKVYGFDSFEGLPEDWRTGFSKGKFGVDNVPVVEDNVELIKGWFQDSLPKFLEEHSEKCAFIHIDCDLYSSAKYVLNTLKDRIVEGTIISFDEYFNYPGWQEGEYKAFKEFVEENNIMFKYLYYVDTHEQVSVKITRI